MRYGRISFSSKRATGWSWKTAATMSGTVMSWKMRQSAVRVSSQGQGLSVIS